jgi:hypothetical protein
MTFITPPFFILVSIISDMSVRFDWDSPRTLRTPS